MPPEPNAPRKMPFEKYRPSALPLELPDRTWPDKSIDKAPLWCSVDLRDGNQALIDPMDPARKLRMFDDRRRRWASRRSRSASRPRRQPDFDFVRQLIEEDLDPRRRHDPGADPVPARADRAHLRVHRRARRSAIVHFYNSTSILQRRVVFGLDKAGITEIAVDAAKLCRKLEETLPGTEVRYEYSPESFTGTEIDYAVEICEAVMDVIEPTVDRS